MWAIAVFVFLGLVGMSSAQVAGVLPNETIDFDKEFNDFKKNHSRSYKDASEEASRFATFKQNYQELLEIKSRQHQGSPEFGVTRFMDWTQEEKQKINGARPELGNGQNLTMPNIPPRAKRQASSYFDWRDHNAVSPVKDQGQCGDCWAFASASVINTAFQLATGWYANHNNSYFEVSEQNLLDCTPNTNGCNGGDPGYALAYTRSVGLDNAGSYPYTGVQGTGQCGLSRYWKEINDWWFAGQDETQLTGTLSFMGSLVYMMWVPNSMYYLTSSSGVYYPSAADCQAAKAANSGHAVAVVGYGVDPSGTPYWSIKNSWGTGWGNAGYFKLYRGANVCSIGASWYSASTKAGQWTCNNVQPEWQCKQWQGLGYCAASSQYYSYMVSNCNAACGFCSSGVKITLQCNIGLYVSSSISSGGPLVCNSTSAGARETFTLIDVGNGQFALNIDTTWNGVHYDNYVSSENGVGPMSCNRTSLGSWETFTFSYNNDGSVSLMGNNGDYVSSNNGASPLTCNRTSIGSWEKFKITQV